jgi:hypothetical protein
MCACNYSENKNKKVNITINKEIESKLKLLNTSGIQTDSLKANAKQIDSNINSLILLSKDIENMSAVVFKANQYFNTLSQTYKLNSNQFITIKTGMHVDDVTTILKENELKFFNLILIKNNRSDLLLNTAK